LKKETGHYAHEQFKSFNRHFDFVAMPLNTSVPLPWLFRKVKTSFS